MRYVSGHLSVPHDREMRPTTASAPGGSRSTVIFVPWGKNARTGANDVSDATATTTKSSVENFDCSVSIDGVSSLHGGQLVCQKLTNTTRPRYAASADFCPV